MISNFPSKNLYNPGGYSRFYFLPISSVKSFPIILNGVAQTAVELKSGHSWFEGYSTPETLRFSEEVQDDPNGLIYIQILSGFVPGDKSELVILLQRMESNIFLGMIKDPRGKYKLIGSPTSPLELRSNFSSGEKRSDLKGFAFKFTAKSIFRAPEGIF